jgi:hypothetical protein
MPVFLRPGRFRRKTVLADKPFASAPTKTFKASPISPLEIPFRDNQGSAASSDFVRAVA